MERFCAMWRSQLYLSGQHSNVSLAHCWSRHIVFFGIGNGIVCLASLLLCRGRSPVRVRSPVKTMIAIANIVKNAAKKNQSRSKTRGTQ